MTESSNNMVDRLIGLILGLVTLTVYVLTLSVGAYPGLSASLIVEHTGILPRMNPAHPLWAGLVSIITHIPIGGLVFRLNIFSAFCGAASVWLLYNIMAGAIFGAIEVYDTNRTKAKMAARLAGIASAVFLAFSVPFWIVSNRAHTASFDIFLLLAATWFFLQYTRRVLSSLRRERKRGHERLILVFAFLYGLGIVEFATFIIFAPLFGFSLLFLLWKSDQLQFGPISRILLCLMAGLSLYLLAAWNFYGSAGHELRGHSSYFKIVWLMWRDQYLLITRSLPSRGWLIILIVTVVPWLTCLLVGRRALNEEKDWAYYLLHILLTGLALAILLNAKHISPWSMLGFRRLLVTPYVLTASVFGYLIAYWYLLPTGWWPDTERPRKLWIRKWFGAIIIAPGMMLLAVMPLRSLVEANGQPAESINRHATEIVKSLSGRSWLVTDGSVDKHVLIAAREMGYPLHVLNLHAGDNEVYMKYVASMFDKPRLKNLALIGLFPLLRGWFESDPDVAGKVAVLHMPDLWLGADFRIIPNKLVFFGTKEIGELNAAELFYRHEQFWSHVVPYMKQTAVVKGPLAAYAQNSLRHMSKVANNLGVCMEDLSQRAASIVMASGDARGMASDKSEIGESEAVSALNIWAVKAYSKARDIDPGNVSALLNLLVMLEKGSVTLSMYSQKSAFEQEEMLRNDLDDLVVQQEKRYDIWSLSRYYGSVRTPRAFAMLGQIWSLSGQPGMAISEFKRAMDILPSEEKGPVQERLAGMYLLQEEDGQSEALYRELLLKNPQNQRAVLGLARIATRKGDFEKAKDFLRKIKSTGTPQLPKYLEWAFLHMTSGNLGRSRVILEEVIELKPDHLQAWIMLAEIALQQNDVVTLEKCIKKLGELKGGEMIVSLLNGRLALKKNAWQDAKESFEKALRMRPNTPQLLDWILRIDLLQGKMDDAALHVRRLLLLDADNAFGNYVIGSLQVTGGEDELAVDSLRKSLETKRTPGALNDLAWLLQKQGSYAAAEKLAREALEINGRMHQGWDTLGLILMKTGRLDEAEKALERCLSLFKGDRNGLMHMTELHVLKGNKKKARKYVDRLAEKWDQLSLEDQDKVKRLRYEISL